MAKQPETTSKSPRTSKPAAAKKPARKAAPRKAAPKKTAPKKAAPVRVLTRPKSVVTAPETVTRLKFTLYNLLGKERAHYLVDRVPMERSPDDIPEKSV